MITKKPITPKQKAVLDYIKDFKETHGYSPTQRDMQEAFDCGKNNISRYLSELEKRGHIERVGNYRPIDINIL